MSGRKSILRDPKLAEQIQAMRQYGTSIEDVSRAVGISVPTLRKLYAGELEKGVALANIAVGKKLFERCLAGDAVALIYWTKARMGWREKDGKDEKAAPEDTGKQLAAAFREALKSVGE